MPEKAADEGRAGVPPPLPPPAEESNLRWALRQAEEALRGLQFGAVTLLVHDGVVVQVERTERRRYPRRRE